MYNYKFNPVVSLFPNLYDTHLVSNLRLSEVIERITSLKFAEQTEKIHSAFIAAGSGMAGKEAIKKMKCALPAITLAGIFTHRSAGSWQDSSELVQIDLDNLNVGECIEVRQRLMTYPWIACLWTSPSGAGLKGAVRVMGLSISDASRYKASWKAVTHWLASIGLNNDPAANDCSRLAFLAHDPTAYYNPNTELFDMQQWTELEESPQSEKKCHYRNEVSTRALAYIRCMPSSIQGSNGSAAMMSVIRTLRDGFNMSGVELWRVLGTWNSEMSNPPWSDFELKHALESVEKVPPTRGRGWLLNAGESPHANKQHTNTEHPNHAWASERLMAERLAAGNLCQSLRYVPDGTSLGWRSWNGSCWIAMSDPVPIPLAANIHSEAGTLIASGLLDSKTARTLESTASMKAVLAQLQAHERMRINTSTIDPPQLLATPGGVFDLTTSELMKADPSRHTFLRCAAVTYNPSATHSLWDSVAAHVATQLGGDTVQRFLGASLIGVPPDRKMLFLIGDGGDGKGTLLRSCIAAVGDFGTVLPSEALSGDGRGAHGHEILSPLMHARLAYASEVPANLDWPLMKALSGGDPRTSKRMHSRAVTFQPRAWIALATNTAPRVPDQAAADRCILIRWNKPADPDPDIVRIIAIPGPERDVYLRACLRWLIDGAAAYQRDGLGVPDFAQAAIEPEGLARWWGEATECGGIVPSKGWTQFRPLAEYALHWHREKKLDAPTNTAIGTFLRSRVASKRVQANGSKVTVYHASLMDGVGRG